ncbi:MAG: carotenoid oxygenase family protein [Actinomycetota bacterium]
MTAVADARKDPYLSGVYTPVTDERNDVGLEVTGEIPAALVGTYLRNGPNPRFAPKGRYHIFDGDGMLHGLTLDGAGGAAYRNRWVRTEGLAVEERAGRAIYGGMANGEFPTREETGGGPLMKNVANTNVIRHAGRILALWEAGPPTEVTPELATIGIHDFGGALPGPFTAHPKLDPVTGEMLAFGYSAVPPYLRAYVIGPDGTFRHTVDIDLPAPVMMHDFAVTERHLVFLDAPAVFDFASFARGGPMLTWQPDNGTRIGVLPRDGDTASVRWYEVDPCYVFHFMNAFDTADGGVVIDACRLPRMDIGLEAEGGTADADSWLHRFTVDPDSGTASCTQVAELPGDFPRVPAALEGRPHRYGYYASFSSGRPDGGAFDSVTKVDGAGGTAVTHSYGAGTVAGEAVFAADPNGRAEDDGWLLNFVTDLPTMTSAFVVLDARDLSEVARVALPRFVPAGFHGNWLPAGSTTH